ncbi:cyclic nucleotide-binding domain-containing protein [Cellulomonas alba]|uniref:Cyclic nucleotide-binding domain-containing protein n=1 Tax=Cellulomonas alba TaxID=3053467 RepID=A0ABT7SJJ7_9CELL|nr:cyclic nucleotide-binding domain-containing protein [Cellulomonas alba]MDM7856355.1 cyclic nucleotide-binding domain-containing protein [Cellulomonas alba]
MRIEATAVTISWIPSESVGGPLKAGFDLRLSHYDSPPPDHLDGVGQVRELRDADAFRFANVLAVWADVEDGQVRAHGVTPDTGLAMGATTVRVAGVGATFQAASLPVLRREPEALADGGVRYVQTVGGRTGVPLPRPVPHAPFVRWQAPTVWTTVAVDVHPDGSTGVELLGASPFPRHWLYAPSGDLVAKSVVTDQATWMNHAFGPRTPWHDEDRAAHVHPVESALEHELSVTIMRGGTAPTVRRLAEGDTLTRQGEPGDALFLVLDGVLRVDVDGRAVAEVGPGAVLGERALLEGGTRSSTLVATTPVRVAEAAADAIDLDRLRELAEGHHREEIA